MARTRRDVFTTTPEVPFDSSEVEEIVQEIDRSGLLDAEIAQYLHGIRIDSCEHLSELQRTALLQRLYAQPETTINIAKALKEREDFYEEQIRIVMTSIAMAQKGELQVPEGITPIGIEAMLRSYAQNKVDSLSGLDPDERDRILAGVDAELKRENFGIKAGSPVRTSSEEIAERHHFLETLERGRNTFIEVARLQIMARARDARSKITDQNAFYDEDDVLRAIADGNTLSSDRPAKFLIDAPYELEKIRAIEHGMGIALEQELEDGVSAEMWAVRIAPRVAALLAQSDLTEEDRRELERLFAIVGPYREGNTPTDSDRVGVKSIEGDEMRRCQAFVERLENLPRVARDAMSIIALSEQTPAAQLLAQVNEKLTRIENIKRFPLLTSHFVARTLDLDRHMQRQIAQITYAQKRGERCVQNNQEAEAQRVLAPALHLAERIENAFTMLKSYRTRDISKDKMVRYGGSERTQGMYRMIDGIPTVLINTDALAGYPPERRDLLIMHETGHMMIDVLVRESKLLPTLLVDLSRELRANNADFDQLVQAEAANWGKRCERAAAQLEAGENDPRYNEFIVDELLNRFSSFKDGLEHDWTEGERRLFAMMETTLNPPTAESPITEEPAPFFETEEAGAAFEGHAELAGDNHHAEDDSQTPDEDAGETDFDKFVKEIKVMEEHKKKIDAFVSGFVKLLHPNDQEKIKGVRDRIAGDIEKVNEICAGYQQHPTVDQYVETLKTELGNLQETNKRDDEIIKKINEFEGKQLDISERPAQGRDTITYRLGFRIMTLYDIYKMFTDAKEDITRMWERRSQHNRAESGFAITKHIPGWVPYVGRLKNEFRRRKEQSELDEVGVWEKAYENTDSHALQDQLAGVTNQDELKAMLNLLTKRGHAEWNDEELWKTLNTLSRYKMPFDQCRNNDVLRDAWLRKLITDIWGDKELYFHWRQSNDSNFDSHKKQFTPTADQLSNVSGGLRNELKKQLEIMKRVHDQRLLGIREAVPEDVNPHLYEEVLWYAIRNGKLTMEDKFYYLVMGIHYDILSIDRLRVLAGEGGEILNRFPFIDYFYGRNNTMPEIHALAKRLLDDPSSKGKFVPGTKTSLFVQLEVARAKSTKERLSKGIQRIAEGMDHEDIPYFVSQLGHNEASNLFDIISGSRQKVTFEGAKNAYIGFNIKFQAFRSLIHLHERGLERFTADDAKDMAQTITTFIHLDNLLREYGRNKDSYQKLSEAQYDSVAVMGAAGVTTRKYRDELSDFASEVLDAVDFDWNTFEQESGLNRKRNNKGEIVYKKDAATGKETNIPETEEAGAGARKYFEQRRTEKIPSKVDSEAVYNASGKFQELLQKAILRNPQAFLNVLKNFQFTEAGCSNAPPNEAIEAYQQSTKKHAGSAH